MKLNLQTTCTHTLTFWDDKKRTNDKDVNPNISPSNTCTIFTEK